MKLKRNKNAKLEKYPFEKENIFLIELSDVGAIKKEVKDGKEIRGLAIFRMFNHNSKLVSKFDKKTQTTDLSFLEERLKNKEVTWLVLVTLNENKEKIWKKFLIEELILKETKRRAFTVIAVKECDTKEEMMLDTTFLNWKENCFFTKKEDKVKDDFKLGLVKKK